MGDSKEQEILDRTGAAEFLRVSVRKLDGLVARKLVPYSEIPPEQGSRGKKLFLKARLLECVLEWESK